MPKKYNMKRLDDGQVVKEYNAGASFRQLALTYDCSVTKIRNILYRTPGVVLRPPKPRSRLYSPAARREALERLDELVSARIQP